MGCCGQKRQTWQNAFGAQRRQDIARPVSPPLPVLQNPRVLQYTGPASFMVRGAVTRNVYLFAAGGPGLAVDERDVAGLLKMAGFARGE